MGRSRLARETYGTSSPWSRRGRQIGGWLALCPSIPSRLPGPTVAIQSDSDCLVQPPQDGDQDVVKKRDGTRQRRGVVGGLFRQRRVGTRPRANLPKQAEAGSVPAKDSLWLHAGNRPAPTWEAMRHPEGASTRLVSPSLGRFVLRRSTLIWCRSMALSMVRSRRERTTSAATPTTSLPDARGPRLRQIRRETSRNPICDSDEQGRFDIAYLRCACYSLADGFAPPHRMDAREGLTRSG